MITEFEVDGIRYKLDELPPNIVALVARYDVWTADAEKARFELDKAELARQAIQNQILTAVRMHNAELLKQMKDKQEHEPDQQNPSEKTGA